MLGITFFIQCLEESSSIISENSGYKNNGFIYDIPPPPLPFPHKKKRKFLLMGLMFKQVLTFIPQTPSRVKNYHKRIRIASSSSDEDKSILDPDAKIQQPDHQAVLKAGSFKKDSGDPTVPEALDHCHGESDVQSHPHKNTSSQESTDSDDIEEKVTPSQKRHNRRSIFDSDDNSEGDNDNSTQETERAKRSNNLKQKQETLFSNFKDTIAKRKSRLGNSELKNT